MAKNIFSGWKKFSTNGKNTIMAHPSGHKMIIAHKSLKPEHLEQLHSLPFAGADSVQPEKLAKGGKVEKQDPDTDLEARSAAAHKAMDLSDSAESPEMAMSAMAASKGIPTEPQQYAEGTPDAPVEAVATEAPKAPDEGDAITQDAAPKAEAAPTADPALARKRELYNFAAAQLNPSSGGDPRKVLGPNYTFGPNGEAPSQFNPAAWEKANQSFQVEQSNQSSAQNNAAQATMLENKSRQEAGLPPLPVPQAAAQVSQAGKEAPVAGQGAQAMGNAPAAPAQGAGDPYGTNAYYDSYTKGINEQKAGMAQEGKAAEAQGQAQSAAIEQGQQVIQDAQTAYNTHYNNLNQERQNFIKDINDSKIDPQHYWADKSTGSKVASAIGLILGGIGGGLDHTGGNVVMDYLNKQIDRDIEAQKANLGTKRSLLEANMQQFHNIRDAADMTRTMQSDIMSNQLKAEAAKQSGPMAKARLLQAAGQLDQQSAPVLSQIAMRKTILGGMQSGHVAPEQVVRMIVPANEQGGAFKELKAAQNDVALKDNVLDSFDKLSSINTVMGKLNPQTRLQVAALKNATLDKLTKDVSGRVTPETVHLIGSLFDTAIAGKQSVGVLRNELNKLVSQGMHYPMLKAYGIDPASAGRFGQSGKSRFTEQPPNTK